MMVPVGGNWNQGYEVPAFEATSRIRAGNLKHQMFVCSAPRWSLKAPRLCWCWRQSPGKLLVTLKGDKTPHLVHGPGKSSPASGATRLPSFIFPHSTLCRVITTLPPPALGQNTQVNLQLEKHTQVQTCTPFVSQTILQGSNRPGLGICLMVWYNFQSC